MAVQLTAIGIESDQTPQTEREYGEQMAAWSWLRINAIHAPFSFMMGLIILCGMHEDDAPTFTWYIIYHPLPPRHISEVFPERQHPLQ